MCGARTRALCGVRSLVVGSVAIIAALVLCVLQPAGAFASKITFTATVASDSLAGSGHESACTGAQVACSLRQAIAKANASSDTEVEVKLLGPSAYELTDGQLEVLPSTTTKEITLAGNDSTVQAKDDSRVFEIGAIGKSGVVTISDVTITGGKAIASAEPYSEFGGGIFVEEGEFGEEGTQLHLMDSEVKGNEAVSGGGVYARGRFEILDSTISHNSASVEGGGIYNFDGRGELQTEGEARVTNSTIAENKAIEKGGGLYNNADLLIVNSTIADDSAGEGGGIYEGSGLWAVNTLIADDPSGHDCAAPPATSTAFLAESGFDADDDGSCELGSMGLIGDISDSPNLDLQTLAKNGGLTETIAVSASSAAIGAGTPNAAGPEDNLRHQSECPQLDQLGVTRPQPCTIGAYEPSREYTVSANGTGGTVTASTQGAACEHASCTVKPGAKVELSATPTEGFIFTGWTGGKACAQASTCTIADVQGSEAYEANFVLGPPPPPSGTVVLYVSERTGNDGNSGTTPSQPFMTLPRAMEFAEQVSAREAHGVAEQVSQILLAEGNYEGAAFGSFPQLAIYGGLTTEFKPDGGTTTISGSPQALLVEHSTVRLQQLTLDATASEQAGSSGSVYGVRIVDQSTVTLADDHISSASALEGAAGAAGATGAEGVYGYEGDAGETSANAFELFGATSSTPGGTGGYGPNGTLDGTEYSDAPCPEPGSGRCRIYGSPNPEYQQPGDGGIGGYGFDPTRGEAATTDPGDLGGEVYGCFYEATGQTCGIAFKEICDRPGEALPASVSASGECGPDPELVPGGFYKGYYEQPFVVAQSKGSKGGIGIGCIQPNCKAAATAGGGGGEQGSYEGPGGEKVRNGGSGAPGNSGATGGPGPSGTAEHAPAAITEWTGAIGVGGEGQTGSAGGGGGGGGGGSGHNYGNSWLNPVGDGGGGGGSGGTGGTGGRGGQGGGGAFGLFVTANSKAIVDLGTSISAGSGGTGGNGGNGGAGGKGGAGGAGNTKKAGELGAGGNGGSGGGGGPGGGGGGGAGGPSDAVYTDSGSKVEEAEGTQLSHGSPGAGGATGGAGGSPTVVTRAAEGTTNNCSGACAKNASLPVLSSPVVYLVGESIITVIVCSENCSGTLTLSVSGIVQKHVKVKTKPLAFVAVADAGKPVGKSKFAGKAGKRIELKVRVGTIGLRLLRKDKVLPLTQKLAVKLGNSKKPKTYTSTVLLARKGAPAETKTKTKKRK